MVLTTWYGVLDSQRAFSFGFPPFMFRILVCSSVSQSHCSSSRVVTSDKRSKMFSGQKGVNILGINLSFWTSCPLCSYLWVVCKNYILQPLSAFLVPNCPSHFSFLEDFGEKIASSVGVDSPGLLMSQWFASLYLAYLRTDGTTPRRSFLPFF